MVTKLTTRKKNNKAVFNEDKYIRNSSQIYTRMDKLEASEKNK